MVEEESKEWLEVELSKVARVTGLATQGRWAGGQGQEFAEWVRLQWWSDVQQRWVDAGAPMEANKDTYSKVEMRLEQEVQASKLRIIPVSQHPRMVCLRVELLGCSLDNDEDETDLKKKGKEEKSFKKPEKAPKKSEGDLDLVGRSVLAFFFFSKLTTHFLLDLPVLLTFKLFLLLLPVDSASEPSVSFSSLSSDPEAVMSVFLIVIFTILSQFSVIQIFSNLVAGMIF